MRSALDGVTPNDSGNSSPFTPRSSLRVMGNVIDSGLVATTSTRIARPAGALVSTMTNTAVAGERHASSETIVTHAIATRDTIDTARIERKHTTHAPSTTDRRAPHGSLMACDDRGQCSTATSQRGARARELQHALDLRAGRVDRDAHEHVVCAEHDAFVEQAPEAHHPHEKATAVRAP